MIKHTQIGLALKRLKRLEKYIPTEPAFTCSKLTIETLGQGVKYIQS